MMKHIIQKIVELGRVVYQKYLIKYYQMVLLNYIFSKVYKICKMEVLSNYYIQIMVQL